MQKDLTRNVLHNEDRNVLAFIEISRLILTCSHLNMAYSKRCSHDNFNLDLLPLCT